MVLATDYPFGPDEGEAFLFEGARGVEEMDVDDGTRQQVFADNVRSLLS